MFFIRESERVEENADYDYSIYDPLLGYTHNHEAARARGIEAVPGYEVIRPAGHGGGSLPRVMVLGGSTSSRLELCNWPRHMVEIAEQDHGTALEVFSGGVGGYGSSQELIKLIRDLPGIKPGTVVVLSGINDMGFPWAAPGHPMVHSFQATIARSVANGADAFSDFSLGPRDESPAHEHWLRNVRLMKAACEASGVDCLVFLQPVLGAGAYVPQGTDVALFAEHVKGKRNEDGSPYIDALREFYDVVRGELAAGKPDYAHVTDLTDIFVGQEGIYRDSRHPNEIGNRLIAQRICDRFMETRR